MEPTEINQPAVADEQPAAEEPETAAVPVGDFGIGTRIYGYIGTLAHIVTDGRTTACGKQIDQTSPTQRLSRTPGGMLCGACLGEVSGA